MFIQPVYIYTLYMLYILYIIQAVFQICCPLYIWEKGVSYWSTNKNFWRVGWCLLKIVMISDGDDFSWIEKLIRSGGWGPEGCWTGRLGFMGSFGFIRGFVWPPIYPVCGLKYGNTWPTLLMRRDHYHKGRRLWGLLERNMLEYFIHLGTFVAVFCTSFVLVNVI